MAPFWDKLAESFGDSDAQLIADVDCTAEGEPLCEKFGIQGFPTLKWGDPSDLQDYEGGREYDELKEFADENLKPQCSPKNIDLCDADKKAEIQKFMDMPVDELKATIAEKEAAMEKIDTDFEAFISGLQDQYEEMMAKVQEDKDALKKSGLGLMRAVRATLPADDADADEGKDEL